MRAAVLLLLPAACGGGGRDTAAGLVPLDGAWTVVDAIVKEDNCTLFESGRASAPAEWTLGVATGVEPDTGAGTAELVWTAEGQPAMLCTWSEAPAFECGPRTRFEKGAAMAGDWLLTRQWGLSGAFETATRARMTWTWRTSCEDDAGGAACAELAADEGVDWPCTAKVALEVEHAGS